ncbi:MAG: putative zinc-binding metallopeptidase [Nitrospirota bacterium]
MDATDAKPEPEWVSWSDDHLLDLRLCDLHLTIEHSPLVPRLEQLAEELAARGLVFRPHVWISDEWFTPDGIPGIAVPFYLVHPRLAKLELQQMLEVEGGTHDWCMRILRHEVGHAIENAYRLRLRARRKQLFGRSNVPYPRYYTPKPYSKRFVLHLDLWYAQSHPDEDFAETFAVWLNPRSDWRAQYAGWPALKKLEYMDALMCDLAGAQPLVTRTDTVDPLPTLTKTLREHYEARRAHYGLEHPHFYDQDLKRLFTADTVSHNGMRAAAFIARIRKEARRLVAEWTGAYQYTIDKVVESMITRCRELDLRVAGTPEEVKLDFLILLTVQTMNYLHSGRHRVAL